MKNISRAYFILLIFICGIETNVFAANGWKYNRSIEVDNSTKKPVAVELDEKVLDASQEDLADLRILRGNFETPYLLMDQPALEKKYPGSVIKTEVTPESKSVDMIVDFGSKYLPLKRVEINSPDQNFSRKIEIFSSNDGQSWKRVGEGVISSISVGGSNRINRTIKFNENKARYLKLRLYHGDNKPIKVSQVTGIGLKKYIVFIPHEKASHSLSYGNPAASAPAYDIGEVLRNKTLSDFMKASVGAEIKNNDFISQKEDKLWTEAHPYVLWTAMGAIILGLLGLAAQVVQKTK